MEFDSAPPGGPLVQDQADAHYQEARHALAARTDRMFAVLFLLQWAFAVVLALWVSPYTWAGKLRSVNVHVPAAVLLGGLISVVPLLLVWLRPGARINRYVISAAQAFWSALLIHLSGGRIETHFHVFGSLAFLAVYQEWPVLVPATLVVALDHFLRGLYWPESVYGVATVDAWRFLEHAGWVVFEDVVLVMACLSGTREMHTTALRQAQVEALTEDKSRALDAALRELREAHEQQVRVEKLAAVGQLAASVAHELRNPLAAISNAHTIVAETLSADSAQAQDARLQRFLGLASREIESCNRTISDLLDFARERPPQRAPCVLRELVAEAVSLVPPRSEVQVLSEVPEGLRCELDREQFRKVLINLIQNAVEAVPAGTAGTVRIQAEGGGALPVRITVADTGAGIPPELLAKVFQPLYTTKTKGTGLGLAIVANIIERHGAAVRAESQPGQGSRFLIELPPSPQPVEPVAAAPAA
jgi:signal transduction histidine kinase